MESVGSQLVFFAKFYDVALVINVLRTIRNTTQSNSLISLTTLKKKGTLRNQRGFRGFKKGFVLCTKPQKGFEN